MQRGRGALVAVAAACLLAVLGSSAAFPSAQSAFTALTASPGSALSADQVSPPSGLVATPTCSGGSTIAFRSAATTTGGTSLTLSAPSGVQAGDLLLAQITHGDGTVAVTPPSGWTPVRSDASGEVMASAVFWRIAVGNDPAATFSRPGASLGSMLGAMAAYSGVDAGAPIAAAGATTGAGRAVTTPSVTTTATGAVVVHLLSKKYE